MENDSSIKKPKRLIIPRLRRGQPVGEESFKTIKKQERAREGEGAFLRRTAAKLEERTTTENDW